MEILLISSIRDIHKDKWDALNLDQNPFMSYDFLSVLEDSRCTSQQTGWIPSHICLVEDDEIHAVAPCYLKQHSYGEYVFDWSWADAYDRYGFQYYPKLLTAVPFTPSVGPRILGSLQHQNLLLEKFLQHTDLGNYSGWHINYTTPDNNEVIGKHNFLQRYQCQFHWFNYSYKDFNDFLSKLTSRKRKAIKKERQKLKEMNISVKWLTGNDINPQHLNFFYNCYLETYKKRRSTPYLTFEFFTDLIASMPSSVLLMVAQNGETDIASALYFQDKQNLYGRYWGSMEDVDGLHFELCYYQGIEYCISAGLQKFDPGTQGEHKISRGFEPTLTYSWHHINNESFRHAISDFVELERRQVMEYKRDAELLLPFNENWMKQNREDLL